MFGVDSLGGLIFGLAPDPLGGLPTMQQNFYTEMARQMANYLEHRFTTEPLTDEAYEILREGCGYSSPLQNVAEGPGFALMSLIRRGMMEPDDHRDSYRITSAGRAELERKRKADLAAIGVYEC